VEALSIATMTMLDVARLAEELILWSSSEFDLVEMDDDFSASSSIMPQKKNAVVAEISRAKAGAVIGELVAVCSMLKGLPYSYNLDLQETTPHLWKAVDDTASSLEVMAGAVSTLKVKSESARKAVLGDSSTAVALANFLVKEGGVSFREAHSMVGRLVRSSLEKGISLSEAASRPGAFGTGGRKITIDPKKAKAILDPDGFLSSIATEGGSNPRFIRGGLVSRRRVLSKDRESASKLSASIRAHEKKLRTKASAISMEVKTRS